MLKSAKNYREAALDEIHILTTIKQADVHNVHCILLLLDNFEVQSQFGRRMTLVEVSSFVPLTLRYRHGVRKTGLQLAPANTNL
jgi:hypothetical protein